MLTMSEKFKQMESRVQKIQRDIDRGEAALHVLKVRLKAEHNIVELNKADALLAELKQSRKALEQTLDDSHACFEKLWRNWNGGDNASA